MRESGLVELSLADGGERLLLPQLEDSMLIEPSLSPDGQTLAYVRQFVDFVLPGISRDLGTDIFLANRDGSDPRLLAEHADVGEQLRHPAWLATGEELLVTVRHIVPNSVTSAIERVDVATGERTAVADDAFAQSVSPDGTRMVFLRENDELLQSLWVANVDGSGATMLAGPDDNWNSFNSPRFSPDGTQIAFAGSMQIEQQVGHSSLTDDGWLGSSPAGQRRPRASASAGAQPPRSVSLRPLRAAEPRSAVGADAVTSYYNGLPMDIWTIQADGSGLRQLADTQLDQPGLTWSGDGERLFVLSALGLLAIDAEEGLVWQVGAGTFHGQLDWLSADEATE